tara:strand:+ start:2799 stop:2942 length:144 start_codon:yes stop_codon:yes gene_type:complete
VDIDIFPSIIWVDEHLGLESLLFEAGHPFAGIAVDGKYVSDEVVSSG